MREGLQDSVVHIGNSNIDKRSWHVIHATSGPILVCVCNRRPEASEVASVKMFVQEYKQFSKYGVLFVYNFFKSTQFELQNTMASDAPLVYSRSKQG